MHSFLAGSQLNLVSQAKNLGSTRSDYLHFDSSAVLAIHFGRLEEGSIYLIVLNQCLEFESQNHLGHFHYVDLYLR